MCGIAGWVRHVGEGPDPSGSAMRAAMRHRGPDDSGEIHLGRAQLVMQRLALLDLPGGHQPVTNERGDIWAVFNGEIYNHAELHRTLVDRGHRLSGHGDSELIPHLYEEWGPECVRHLRGMFAIAVYDTRSGELILARDPFGIKPLVVLRTAQHVVFGSEARTVMAGAGRLGTDPASLWHYLTFGYVPDPATMWEGLVKVPAGHYAQIRHGDVELHRYWHPSFEPAAVAQTMTTSADTIERALRDSVSAHMLADVPVGAYLSSGVDSSLLVSMASKRANLKTFTVGFDLAAGSLDELEPARRLAARLGTEHVEEVISTTDCLEALPQIASSQEDPLADPSAPALWFLARSAAREVKAVLSGEGADELFAGYPLFAQAPSTRAVAALPAPVKRLLARGAASLPDGTRGKGLIERGVTPLEQRWLGNSTVFDETTKTRLLKPGLTGDLPPASYPLAAGIYADTQGAAELVRMQSVCLQTWLPSSILMKADKMSMAHSLEVRVPFLDREGFAAAASLPLAHRVRRSHTKVALRAAAERHLPAEFAQRPKLGFPVPFRLWLEGAAGFLLRELLISSDDPLIDRTVAEEVCRDDRRPDRHRRQWALLMYFLWKESYP